MAEAQISLENIVENIKKVASDLLPSITKDKDGPKIRIYLYQTQEWGQHHQSH